MGYRSYADETKAAVMAAILVGQSVTQVETAYEIPKRTVSNWERKGWEAAADGFGASEGLTQVELGVLVLDYLRARLKAPCRQAELFSNKEWPQQQSTTEVAILHGVMTDKAVRLLEALPFDTAPE